jgi:hypothetical protein
MNIDELERLARGVTEPKWRWDDLHVDNEGHRFVSQGAYLGGTLICLSDTYEGCSNDALFVQAVDAQTVLKLIAVVRAAQRYYEGYAQDEADDGEYAVSGMPGHNTGCSEQQARDALALREALAALKGTP